MARKKIVDPYDFAAFRKFNNDNFHYVEAVKTKDEIVAISRNRITNMEKNGEYISRWFRDSVEKAEKGGYDSLASYERTQLRRQVWECIPTLEKDREEAIFAWYKATPEAQEVYVSAMEKMRYINHYVSNKDAEGNEYVESKWLDKSEYVKLGLDKAPLSGLNVAYVLDSSEGRTVLELLRRQPYMEGDIILLRKPYHKHSTHDPHWDKPKGEPRLGTVMSVDADECDGWRAGKGSRLINVIWFGKDGSVQKVPEKIIKLESRKGRQV